MNGVVSDQPDPGPPGERRLPDGLVPARRTPEFTADSVPPALLGDHHTTVWARLEVSAGTVSFVEGDGPAVVATPGRPVVIVPNRPHRVTPSADASFAVQFFDRPGDHRSD